MQSCPFYPAVAGWGDVAVPISFTVQPWWSLSCSPREAVAPVLRVAVPWELETQSTCRQGVVLMGAPGYEGLQPSYLVLHPCPQSHQQAEQRQGQVF